MARVTVRQSWPPLSGTLADLFPHGALIVDGWGRRAVADIQRGPWADARFKRPSGRSRKAWTYTVDKQNLGLSVESTATNRYGTNYPPYVHYAGTPRSAKVYSVVQALMDQTIAPEIVAALGRDFKAGLKRRVKRG